MLCFTSPKKVEAAFAPTGMSHQFSLLLPSCLPFFVTSAVTRAVGLHTSEAVPSSNVPKNPWMQEAPPLCAQETVISGPATPSPPTSASDGSDEDDEEELVDDDELLRDSSCGRGGRPSSRLAKTAAALPQVITARFVFAKSRSHCALVPAHQGIAEPKSGWGSFVPPGADTPRSRNRMRESKSKSAASRRS